MYSTANDPQPQMIPRPQMIPKMDRKWLRLELADRRDTFIINTKSKIKRYISVLK